MQQPQQDKEADRKAVDEVIEQLERSYVHAITAQRQRELGAEFAHRCLKALIWVATALVLALALVGFLGWQVAFPPVKYFATENGRVVPIQPTDKPAFSDRDVSAFGADTIRESFTLDFVNFRNQTTRLSERYSDIGYQDYYKALTTSNVLDSVEKRRMNLSVEVGPGVIRSKGLLGDVFTWEYQYPVTLRLDGQQTGSPAQNFIFTLRIQRTDVQVKSKGLEVTQVISSNSN